MTPRSASVALTLALALSVVAAGCGSRAMFEPRSFEEVEQALTNEGLQICDVAATDGHANQAEAGREYRVAVDCEDDEDGTVVVDEFDASAERDAAARQVEVQARPRAGGAVWTLGPFTIAVSGAGDGDVVGRITDALDRAGAR